MEDLKVFIIFTLWIIWSIVMIRMWFISPITERLDKIIKLLTKEDDNVVGNKK